MTTEIRNEHGFPVVSQLEAAQAYAAAARKRNRLPCNCPTCRQNDLLPAVLQILAAHKDRHSSVPQPVDIPAYRMWDPILDGITLEVD